MYPQKCQYYLILKNGNNILAIQINSISTIIIIWDIAYSPECFDLQLQSIFFPNYFGTAKRGCFSIILCFTRSGRDFQQKFIKGTRTLLFSQWNRYLDQTKSIHGTTVHVFNVHLTFKRG